MNRLLSPALLAGLCLIVSGCTTGPTIIPTSSATSPYEAFTRGDIRLTCGLYCAGAYGWHKLELKRMYDAELWKDLALLIMDVGFEQDHAYFCLGRAAEELGFSQAAEVYYRLSSATIYKCGTAGTCYGLDLPQQTVARLTALAARKTQNVSSPAAASVATPTTASEPVKIAPSRKVETASSSPNVGVCRETGRSEEVEWKEAKKTATIVAYRRYIDVCEPAKYLPEAVDAIARMQGGNEKTTVTRLEGNTGPARATLESSSASSKGPLGPGRHEGDQIKPRLEASSVPIPHPASSEVRLLRKGGVYQVPVMLNGVLTIHMIMDSGAGELSITPDVFFTLARTGTVRENDILEPRTYRLADGSRQENARLRLQSVKIGDREIKNVACSISSTLEGAMLLGQSALEKLGKYSVDYSKGALVLY